MANVEHYDRGDVWTPQANFTVNNVATDPTTITARIMNPDGTTTSYGPYAGATAGTGITRVSAGIYRLQVQLDDAGYWYARFEGTGAAEAAITREAVVNPDVFDETAQLTTRALVSLAETRDWLQFQRVDYDENMDLSRVINDVSDRLMEEADREFKVFGTNPQTRTFAIEWAAGQWWYTVDGEVVGYGGTRNRIRVGDLAAFTTIQVRDLDWSTVVATLTAVRGLPLNRKPWEPFTELEFNTSVTSLQSGRVLAVTGTWGFPSVPGSIRQACLDGVAWVMDRDVEHYRTDLATPPPGEGGTTIMMQGSQRILSLPPVVLAAAWNYRMNASG